MKTLMTLILTILLAAIAATAQQKDCQTVTGLPIPCATIQEKLYGPYPKNPKQMSFAEPLFDRNNVEKDSPLSQIDTLNNPNWVNAHRAAIERIYRNYKIFVATEMIMAVQKAIVNDVKQRYGLKDSDYMQILELIVREHGLPTLNLQEMGVTPSPILQEATGAISGLGGGR